MTDNDAPHAGFRFDDSKSVEENYEAFLTATKADDPEMAAILSANWAALVASVRLGERDLKARSEVNAKIASALDDLVARPADDKGST